MKKLLAILLVTTTLISCKKKPLEPTEVCPGGCITNYTISSPSATLQSDGYWHVKHIGANYFQVIGNLSELNSKYVVNGVPLIEVNFDSDYWVLFDSIQYKIPMYSYLSWFSDSQFNNPISIGTHTYTLKSVSNIHPPLNIAGYQINKHMCWDCPYTSTLLGTHSKYTYKPKQNFFFDNEMIGDTAHIYIETIFNSDIGSREKQNTVLKVIFE
jgi:hypothetical protein